MAAFQAIKEMKDQAQGLYPQVLPLTDEITTAVAPAVEAQIRTLVKHSNQEPNKDVLRL